MIPAIVATTFKQKLMRAFEVTSRANVGFHWAVQFSKTYFYLVLAPLLHDFVLKVVAIEAGEEPASRGGETELGGDIGSDPRGGGGGERHHRHPGVALPQRAQPLVVWSEVMAPLRHTVLEF